MLMTVYGFARVLTGKQFNAFTACLAIAMVLAASIAVFIMMGGVRVDNGPRTALEEAQEWVCNNFRVDHNGSLCLD